MKLVQSLPDAIRAELERTVDAGAELLVCMRSDIGPDGSFGENWLIASDGRILTLGREGADGGVPEDAPVITGNNIPIEDVSSVHVEHLVGAGSLQVNIDGHYVDVLRYSNALSRNFATVARVLDKFVKNGEMPPHEGADEQRFCPKCNRPLPAGSQVCFKCVSKVRTLRRLAGYLKPYTGRAITLLVLMLTGAASGLLPPWLIKKLTDEVLIRPEEQAWLLLPIFLGIVGAYVGQMGLRVAHRRLAAYLGHSVVFDLRAQVYRQLQMLSLSFYDRRKTGAMMSRVSHDTSELQHFIIDALPWTITSMFVLVLVTGRMLWKSTWVTLWVTLPVPLLFFAGKYFIPRLFTLLRRFFERRSRLNAALSNSLSGIRVVKAFGQEDVEIGRFSGPNRELRDAGWTLERYWVTVMPVLGLISMSGGILIYYFGGRSVINQELSLGDFIEFTMLVGMFRGPVEALLRLSHWLTHAITSTERLFEIIDSEPDIQDADDAVDKPEIEGRVELRDVTFGYEEHKPVLHDISLKLQPGEMLGLVGPSGSGKSTLINMVCRLYDANEGQVLIDGVDIRKIKRTQLHSRIGVVLQETFLFHGSIAENIAYGQPSAELDMIIRSAKAANAHDFIVNFPDGYDTQVGERGSRLSGGEKQRIAIARAILHDPSILILDEATSSVDTQTEHMIQQALERLTTTRTTIAIAHRLSTLKHADRLLVLKDGKQVETGTHDELIAKGGTYCDLVEMQQEMLKMKTVSG